VKVSALFDVTDQVAFVTGAASGLGLAFAEVMAENGAHVMLSDIDAAALEHHTSRLRKAGYRVESAVVDIGDAVALQAAIDGAAQAHGRLDAVFANAGVSAGPGFAVNESGQLENVDVSTFQRVLDVNLTATLLTMKFAVPYMKQRRYGSIVATTSIAGIAAEPLVGYAYAATKAAVGNVVRQAAVELAPHNVRVNAIAPGPFFTNIGNGRLHREPGLVKAFSEMVPMGRLAQPDEIKGLALLLASPAGSFITGTVIPIDGGATAK
jgi:NAD(P)-dependent dehydrogenase (short-subunit alcohol dehydrogenase family)